jgi:hypothetical protein
LFVGVGMSWRRLLDTAVALTYRHLDRCSLGCPGASAPADRTRVIAARDRRRWLGGRGRGW